MSAASIAERAARIAENTSIVKKFYTQNDLPAPAFDHKSPLKPLISLTTAPEIEAGPPPNRHSRPPGAAHLDTGSSAAFSRLQRKFPAVRPIVETSQWIIDVTNTPDPQATDLVDIQGITRLGLTKRIPIGGEATLEQLATHASIGETHMHRILRLAIAQLIFQEIRPGVVAHTAASRLLAEDEELYR